MTNLIILKGKYFILVTTAALFMYGCAKKSVSNASYSSSSGNGTFKRTGENPGDKSSATGVSYTDKNGFYVPSFKGVEAPNLVYVEGGRVTIGSLQENPAYVRDNIPRTVTVASFYMDETEVANIHWVEYLYFLERDSTQEAYKRALPDTAVWSKELAFNDSYTEDYLRHPGFRYFPVVGISWTQATEYCKWRTKMANKVLAEKYKDSGTTMLTATYRLPTEAEWEYAALGLIGTREEDDEIYAHNRIYPWDGTGLRNNKKNKNDGSFLANFKRGRGDYAGIAGKANDGAAVTDWIYEYPPNDFGLYNMAGNVNEWVQDVYRPLSYQDVEDVNPGRRSGYLDEERMYNRAGGNSLIDNHSRVYKGGSWKDSPYWLSPGTRRFLDQDSASATIGFRCVTAAVGERQNRKKIRK